MLFSFLARFSATITFSSARGRARFRFDTTCRQENVPAYYFLYATKSPMQVTFLQVRYSAPALPDCGQLADEDRLAAWDRWYPHVFYSCPSLYIMSDQRLPFPTGADVFVMQHLAFAPPGRIVSAADPEPLSVFLANLPPLPVQSSRPARTSQGSSHARSSSALDEALEQNPWLQEYIKQQQPSVGQSSLFVSGHNHELPLLLELPDEVIDNVWERLAEKRRQWELEGHELGADFGVHIRGGKWTAANRGVPFDCVRAQPAPGTPRDWCVMYGMPNSASFSYSKYGEGPASVLALQWCARMQYLFDIWKAQSDPRYVYLESDNRSYQEDAEFRAFVDDLPVVGTCIERVKAIREIFPKPP
jgi:hypothetical protein